MKNNKGFTLIELLVVLVCLTIVSVYAASYLSQERVIEKNKSQINSVLDLRRLMQEYTYYHGIPDSLTQMVTNGYDFTCARTATHCPHINKTVWGDPITFSRGTDGKMNRLKLELTHLNEKDRKQFQHQFVQQLPTTIVDNKSVTYEFNLSSDKAINITAGSAGFDDKGFLKQDGSRSLTGDWDVGNHKITNLNDVILGWDDKDHSVKGLSVKGGLIQTQGVQLSGQFVDKPVCGIGFEPKIITWINGIQVGGSSNRHPQFSSVSSYYTNYFNNGEKQWELWGRFTALVNDKSDPSNGEYVLFNDPSFCGYKNSNLCVSATVLIGYMTFCREV